MTYRRDEINIREALLAGWPVANHPVFSDTAKYLDQKRETERELHDRSYLPRLGAEMGLSFRDALDSVEG